MLKQISQLLQLVQHQHLITQLTKRDVLERYRGSYFGLAWSFAYPVLMLLVYMFVFGVIFKMKWGIDPGSGIAGEVNFGVVIFSGLILHAFLGECFVRSTSLITGNQQYVKKVVFPLPILSIVTIGTALFHLMAGLAILLLFALVTGTQLHWTIIYTPLILIPFVMLMLGISWLLSAICVFVRDIAQIMGVLVTVLLFLAPIFYPLSRVPEAFQAWMYLNPLTAIIQQFRQVLLFGQHPDWLVLGIYAIIGFIVMSLGYAFFRRTQGGFADVV